MLKGEERYIGGFGWEKGRGKSLIIISKRKKYVWKMSQWNPFPYSKLKPNFKNKLPMSAGGNHSHSPQMIATVYNL